MRELSASGLSMFRNCPKSFEYKYIQGIKRVDQIETEQLTIGKVFHSILEGEPLEAELEPKLQMSIEASADFVKNNYVIEALGSTLAEVDGDTTKEFELKQDGFIGFIDLVIRQPDGDILVDYKYVASLDYANNYRISDSIIKLHNLHRFNIRGLTRSRFIVNKSLDLSFICRANWY